MSDHRSRIEARLSRIAMLRRPDSRLASSTLSILTMALPFRRFCGKRALIGRESVRFPHGMTGERK